MVSDTHSTLDNAGESARQIIARHNDEFAKTGATVVTAKTLVSG